jgi:membrane fusion protein, heavy metal efflux system
MPVSSRHAVSRALPVVVLAASTWWIAGCSSGDADPNSAGAANAHPDSLAARGYTLSDSQRARITVRSVAETTFMPVLEVTGNVAFNGDHSTAVLSQISGPVTRILAQPGTMVHAGDALAVVSSPDFASAVADYRKADAASRNAKRIADRDEELFRNDALARSDLDQARTDLAAAAADLDAATQQLRALGVDDETVAAIRDGTRTVPVEGIIRAPIAGTVVEKLISPGQVLEGGGTVAFTVADLSTMWVFANVFESDLAVVHEGEAADIITDASKTPVPGRIDYIAALVDPATKAAQVRVVAQNPRGVLKRDMLVRVQIHADRPRKGILLPASAVMHDDDNLPFVFLAQQDGSFVRRRLDLGLHLGDRYEVISGVHAGERVVLDGALFIQFAESQ